MTTTADRYRQLCEQRAYERRVRVFGLPALLAPYTLRKRPLRLPRQRQG